MRTVVWGMRRDPNGAMELLLRPYELQLTHVFRISHGARTHTNTLLVGLRAGERTGDPIGWGEAIEIPYYQVDRADFIRTLEMLRPRLTSLSLGPPDQVLASLELGTKLHPFIRCALDEALHDLWGKRKGQPLRELWGTSPQWSPTIPTSFTIGQGPVEEMQQHIQERPWPVYKIKLGTKQDLAIIRALRAVTDAPFRVDANTAWTVEQTIAYAPTLRELGVALIEQPLPRDDWEGHRKLFEQSVLPIIADESCQQAADVARCAGHFHGINIKLTKCGGLGPARQMIEAARSLGLQIMVGCMTESSVGISAAAQLLPFVDYADLDGALLLANDPAKGVTFGTDGLPIFPDRSGTGVLAE